jgi:uncharacterized protein YacL
MVLWVIRILFLAMCTTAGYAVSELQPDLIPSNVGGMFIGFGFGGLMIAIDELVKGFSLRAFSAITFGLILGILVAKLVDASGLFEHVEDATRWLIRLCLFLGFGYIGIILSMRSNKEDFALIIPFVRFSRQNKPDSLLLLDTSVIIDGRVADLIEGNFVEGNIVVPRFVLHEIQTIADSADPIKRARGRRGLEMLNRIQHNKQIEVRIHDGDFPDEPGVDAKLVRLARTINAKLFTNDYNLSQVAALHHINCVNMHEMAKSLKAVILPGEMLNLRIVREGKDKGQGVGYLPDGTMVVVNNGQSLVGQQVEVQVQSVIQTGAGVMVFAEAKTPVAA